MERKSVNLLIVATAKYTQFLEPLLDSAFEYFLRGHDVNFCVFTDQKWEVMGQFEKKRYKVHTFEVEHKPWPWATLNRFHFFRRHKITLPKADFFFYLDADTLIKAPITDEILSDRVAVSHCGYIDQKGLPYETNPLSTAYVAPGEGKQYFGGGFWGFSKNEFWKLVDWATAAIDKDKENGIVPVWHDESVLNKYLVDNPPTLVLSPSYHWPQDNPHIWQKWAKLGVSFDCKILLLSKNHKEIRK